MVSTSGSALLHESATNAYLTHLLPNTTLLTPNLPEALVLSKLSGKDFGKVEELTLEKRYELARFLASKAQWILLKGGHAAVDRNGESIVLDILVNSKGDMTEFVSAFSQSKNTHGTGCTLACALPAESELIVASIAANISLGFSMEESVEKAIDFVQGAIQQSFSLGKGNGPLNHLYRQRNLPFTP
jgi:hydroxymethylpyrimidine kinase/phosphomethylpyrimidine kinase